MAEAPIRVLLVDDDEDDFIITRDLVSGIRDRRYELEWIDHYERARDALSRPSHDICLLDYRLGEHTGLELLRELQTSGCRIPVILLTGQGDHEIDVQAMQAGAVDYLVKGQLTSAILERAMRYAIAGSRNQEHLRRERDLISRVMETSPVGIVVADRAGKITFANHCAETALGLSREAIARGSCSVLMWALADHEGNPAPQESSPLQQVIESGRAVQGIRFGINAVDHRRTVFSANAAPLFDSSGKVDGIVVTIQDITDQLSLEAQLRQSQKMESIGQLAAGIAHDINNVLTVIQGHAGLLLAGTTPGSSNERSLKQVSGAADRAARFIRQLLMFSRKQVIQTRFLDINSVLRNLESMLARMLGEDVTLETRYTPQLPSIEADTGMIEQVILNLAVNARDAMPKGGKLVIATTCVTVDAAYVRQRTEARPGRFVSLSVTDTGCGIDRKVLPRIFEPFFSTKEVGRGTGLGLATVYGIIKQHRGWIEVDSDIGRGSTFRIFLPASEREGGLSTEFLMRPGAVRGGKERILVVEDESGLRDLVQQVLQEYGYFIASAGSGAEALRAWAEHDGEFDLLLTDMIMPGGMTGRDLAEELLKRKPDLKVVFTSGYSSELIGKNLSQTGRVFLPKPYLPPQLALVIRECLDGVGNGIRR